MSELFWPGDRRASTLLSERALVAAMTRVERAWLSALREVGVVDVDPAEIDAVYIDPAEIEAGAEAGGNPVIPFVGVLRAALPVGSARDWLHRGLTSQDVLDTALMLCLRDATDRVLADSARQVRALRGLADRYRDAVQAGRTLTQHAVPTTFGLTAAAWLTGVLDAAEDLHHERDRLPVQAGGAGGTLAAVVASTGSLDRTLQLVEEFARSLDLEPAAPWHGNRRPITRLADALLACIAAGGRIANDVLVRVRPEIGELAEPAAPGRGGSSSMPHKHNPVLAVLVKRAAIAAPFTAGQLHAAAAAAVDERPDGAWHVEWAALRTLARSTVSAGSQTAELLEGLVVEPERMAATARSAAGDLLAEQQSLAPGRQVADPAGYLGASEALIDRALARAEAFLKAAP